MQYTVVIEKDPESGWYVGQCEQIPGAISQGETYEELMENMKDAISLMLEYYRDEMRAENKGRKVFYRKLQQRKKENLEELSKKMDYFFPAQ